MTQEEAKAVKAGMMKNVKALIIAECNRIIELLEHNAEEVLYNNTWQEEYKGAELFKKMRELRRDSVTLERIARKYIG